MKVIPFFIGLFLFLLCGVAYAKPLVFIGQDKENITNYLREVQHDPDGFMVYTSIQEMDGLWSESKDRGAGVSDAQYFVDKYPGKSIQIGLWMVDALNEVVEGRYDENIEKLARWVKSLDVSVYLRIGYEFDLPDNNYEPEEYIRAYRYIVDYLNGLNVSNIEYVWHTYSNSPPKKMEWWYPGDEYVDWFGLSYFNSYNSNLPAIARYAKEHNKPLMLAEASPFFNNVTEGEKTWKLFFTRMFEFVEEFDVAMICYANSNWDEQPMFDHQKWGDARIQRNDYIKEQWLRKVTR